MQEHKVQKTDKSSLEDKQLAAGVHCQSWRQTSKQTKTPQENHHTTNYPVFFDISWIHRFCIIVFKQHLNILHHWLISYSLTYVMDLFFMWILMEYFNEGYLVQDIEEQLFFSLARSVKQHQL